MARKIKYESPKIAWLGIPALAHRVMFSEPGKVVATVKMVGRRTITHSIFLEEYKHSLNDRVCCVDNVTLLKLKPGDRLRLYGDKTPFGFTVKRIKGD